MRNYFPFLVILSLLAGCRSSDHNDNGKTVFRYNEAANITSLDPAFARDQANIWATHQLFNGLVQLDDRLKVVPSIASSWEISDKGRLYTFHLRKDVFFHDNPAFPGGKGRRVKAADFLFSFNRITDPGVASPGAWVFNYVEKEHGIYLFEITDDSTFTICLKESFPPFLGLLTTIYCSVVPKEALTFYKEDFRRNPVGTGPFQFKMWKEGVKLVMLRNPRYFEFENKNRLPYLDAVSVTFVPDKQSAFLEFMKGRLDFMSGIDASYKDELLTRDGELNPKHAGEIKLLKQPYLNTEYFGFMVGSVRNDSLQAPERIKEFRQAFNFALDREKMIRYLRNNIGIPGTSGIIPPGLPSNSPDSGYYHYDPEKSRRLLAKAGFPGGKGLGPIMLSTTSEYLDLCKYIQRQVEEIGITMKIDIVPPAALKEMKAQAKIGFFRASWIADYPDAENYLSLFYTPNFCPAGPNYTHFSNKKYDQLYEQAMSETNDSLRFVLYHRMDRLILEEAPIVVLYYDEVLRFIQKNVEGLEGDPMNLLTLKKVRKHNH